MHATLRAAVPMPIPTPVTVRALPGTRHFGYILGVAVVVARRAPAVADSSRVAAQTDQRDQGFPADSAAKGCPVGQDQEIQDCDKIQGPVQQVLVHSLRNRRGEGGQAEAITPTGCACNTPSSL